MMTVHGSHISLRRVSRLSSSLGGTLAKRSNSVSLYDSGGFSYVAQIIIGGQAFGLTLDTGSADLWVISSACSSSDCRGVPQYDADLSTTFVFVNSSSGSSPEPFSLSYLLGGVSGKVATETVALGPYTIAQQTFAVASNTTSLLLSSSQSSGMLGLAFPPTAAIDPAVGTSLLANIFRNPLDPSANFFAIHLGHSALGDDSSFTIGALDSTVGVMNNIDITIGWQYFDVSTAGVGAKSSRAAVYDYWKLSMQALTMNGTRLMLSPSRVPGARSPIAVLDTGTTMILGPTADVDAFWAAAGSSRKNAIAGGTWEVRCDHALLVGVILGDEEHAAEFVMDPSEVNWLAQEGLSSDLADGWCLAGIQPSDAVTSGDWILGDVFLRSVYTTYNAPSAVVPARIGMLSTVNTSISMASFISARGTDANITSLQYPSSNVLAPRASGDCISKLQMIGLTASALLGLLLGVFTMILIMLRRSWMYRKQDQAHVL